MKLVTNSITLLTLVLLVSSCNSVRVVTDYDSQVAFDDYKTFAFYKPGIDQAEISDLDKRRILKAIETELMAKGFTKSTNPDMLVSIFTKASTRVNVYNNAWGYGGWGWGGWGYPYGYYGGWGWGPGWGWGYGGSTVSTSVEGTLFIDLIDYKNKQLIWQGTAKGDLPQRRDKKETKIKEFVNRMMVDFPPQEAQ